MNNNIKDQEPRAHIHSIFLHIHTLLPIFMI